MPAWLAPAIAAGMGLIGGATQNNKDKRQIRQQEKLYDVAEQSNKHMAMFNHDLQMQMWRDTGPVGQMEQLKKAGLNPGLIYGMGGAGGQTAAAAQGQGVSSAQAPSGSGREIEEMAGMGLAMASQVALMDAQKRNIDADTANKEAQTKETLGETKGSIAYIENVKQQTSNSKAQELLTNSQRYLNEIEQDFKTENFETALATAENNLKRSENEFQRAVRQNSIEAATYDTAIKAIKADYAQTLLENVLIKESTKYTTAHTQLTQEQAKTQAQETLQKMYNRLHNSSIEWAKLSEQQRHNQFEEMLKDIAQEQGLSEDLLKEIARGLSLGVSIKQMGSPTRNPIGFK